MVTVVLLYGGTLYGGLVIGLTLGVMIFFGGYISGGAYNPAVTLGMYLNGSMNSLDLLTFIVVEFLAAIAAYLFYKWNLENGFKAPASN